MLRFVLLLAGAWSLASLAQAQVLTLEAARNRALARQPSLAALELNARAIAEAAPAEGALPMRARSQRRRRPRARCPTRA